MAKTESSPDERHAILETAAKLGAKKKEKPSMAKTKKGKSEASANAALEKPVKKIPKAKAPENLDALRSTAENAQAALKDADAKAEAMRQEADTLVKGARSAFMAALAPYKAACKKAGAVCEFKAKSGPVAERVRFLVEKVGDGVKVEIKDRPETAETIVAKELKKSVMKVAAAYCQKHIGPVEEIGFKHAGLYNRIRKAIDKT